MIRAASWNVLAQKLLGAHTNVDKNPAMKCDARIQTMVRLFNEYKLDVIMLQEVDCYEKLKQAVIDLYPHTAWADRGRGHGPCILSKIPMTQTYDGGFYLAADLECSIRVVSVHLKSKPRGEDKRCQQVQIMVDNLFKHSWPIVVGSDWNAGAGADCYTMMYEHGFEEDSGPHREPWTTRKKCHETGQIVTRTTDFVWCRGVRIRAKHAIYDPPNPEMILPTDDMPSDHIPVIREIEMPK